MIRSIIRITVSAIICFLFISAFDFTTLESFSICYSLFFLLQFIDNFGRSIYLILDSIIILACLTWLITPLAFYYIYNDSNELATIWVKTMPVHSDVYYSYVFPGVIALWFGLRVKKSKTIAINFNLNKFRNKFNILNFRRIGLVFIFGSLLASFIIPFIPGSLAYVFNLISKLIFVGLIYLYFSESKPKPSYLFFGFGLLLFTSIKVGMFGEMVFMLLIAAILFSTNFRLSFGKKLIAVVVGITFIILIQSVKHEYRKTAWVKGADAGFFLELIVNRITNPAQIIEENSLFGMAVRFNQGWLIASTMARVPSIVPFANGETIFNSIGAIIIPRFLWPDKPKAGGKYNLERFLGYKDLKYSMNIGPIGEAYANFGKWGGIFFMFLYGLFIRFIFDWILTIADKRPSLIIWLPLLFFYAVGVETDMLTTINSLVKTGIFVAIMFWIFPKVFKVEL